MIEAFQLTTFQVILLGIVQGATEFFPISSTAHLLILQQFFGIDEPSLFFNTLIQFGSVIAIIVYFWKDLLQLVHQVLQKQFKYVWMLLLGVIPVLAVGALLRNWIEILHAHFIVLPLALILVGIFIWIGERVAKNHRTIEDLTKQQGLRIGLFQIFALVPGVSRSGITILGGMFQGLKIQDAARHSFLLGIPALGSAALYELVFGLQSGTLAPGEIEMTFLGFLVAFVASLLTIHLTLGIVTRYGFLPFVMYRIGLGIMLLFWIL